MYSRESLFCNPSSWRGRRNFEYFRRKLITVRTCDVQINLMAHSEGCLIRSSLPGISKVSQCSNVCNSALRGYRTLMLFDCIHPLNCIAILTVTVSVFRHWVRMPTATMSKVWKVSANGLSSSSYTHCARTHGSGLGRQDHHWYMHCPCSSGVHVLCLSVEVFNSWIMCAFLSFLIHLSTTVSG